VTGVDSCGQGTSWCCLFCYVDLLSKKGETSQCSFLDVGDRVHQCASMYLRFVKLCNGALQCPETLTLLAQVWARMVAARSAVLEALSPDTLHQALRRVLPCPPSSRYTAITMLPQLLGVLQRVAWAAQGLVARLTGGGPAAGAGAGLGPSAAAGGQLASSGSLQHEAELAAAAAAAIGATSGQSWRMPGAGQQQRVLVGAGVAAAAVAGIAAVMLARSRR
jgi:hypothetical protein